MWVHRGRAGHDVHQQSTTRWQTPACRSRCAANRSWLDRRTPRGKGPTQSPAHDAVLLAWWSYERWRHRSPGLWTVHGQLSHPACTQYTHTGNCNPAIPNARIQATFANTESWDWWHPNPGIFGLQKFVKIEIFWLLYDKIIIVAI